LKLLLLDYPEEKTEQLTAAAHPNREDMGERQMPFTRQLYIEREDFREEANKKFKRLVLGKRVRLRNAYVIEAEAVVTDEAGKVTEVHCRLVEDTLGKDPADGIKPKGVIHWVSATEGKRAEVRLYDRLFTNPAPDKGGDDYMGYINPDSLVVKLDCVIEPGLADALPEQNFQFERQGYFVADRYDHSAQRPVFNRTIGLRDTWARSGEQGA
jgi:glutaminyl-tRNA synthetase